MFKFRNKSPLIFIGFLIVISILLQSVYTRVVDSYSEMQKNVELQQLKRELLTAMYNASRERSVILLKMYTNDDPFELDDLKMELGEHARDFILARQKLHALPRSESEAKLLEQQTSMIQQNAPLQDEVADLFIAGRKLEAESLLLEEAIPGQRAVQEYLTMIIGIYNEDTANLIGSMNEDLSEFGRDFLILGTLLLVAIVIAIIVATGYFKHQQRQEVRLRDMLKDRKIASEKLSYQASHDALTQLINRTEFENTLGRLITNMDEDSELVVFYLDLDQFKVINDSCGHHAGDELLRQVSVVIKESIRHSDVLARLGGDEFGVILENCGIEQAEQVARNIIEKVGDTYFAWQDKPFRVGASIGIAQLESNLESVTDILKKVDSACFAAKGAGRNRFHVYREDDAELKSMEREINWVTRIEQAIIDDTFELYAQPIIGIDAGHQGKPSFELLIRLTQNDGTLVMPGAFLPAAERYGKIASIDAWVVENSFRFLNEHPDLLERIDYCSINISSQSLTNEDLLWKIQDGFNSYEQLARKICFEITETAAIGNFTQARHFMSTLNEYGCRFALDDFGSGLSSFGYLKSLDIEYIKIDGMFVKDIATDAIDLAMVRSIHEVGKVMGKQTIAEFVEDQKILDHLREIGVNFVQGHHISKPMPMTEMFGYVSSAEPIRGSGSA